MPRRIVSCELPHGPHIGFAVVCGHQREVKWALYKQALTFQRTRETRTTQAAFQPLAASRGMAAHPGRRSLRDHVAAFQQRHHHQGVQEEEEEGGGGVAVRRAGQDVRAGPAQGLVLQADLRRPAVRQPPAPGVSPPGLWVVLCVGGFPGWNIPSLHPPPPPLE